MELKYFLFLLSISSMICSVYSLLTERVFAIRLHKEITRIASQNICFVSTTSDHEYLENEWSDDEKRLLRSEMYAEELPKLCSMLGRGLRSVKSMQSKYMDEMKANDNDKLMPVSEVLQRIRWDPVLQPLSSNFEVLYRDRIENSIMKSSFTAKNENISGKEEMFVFALPEHRIEAIRYKERTVWNKELRLDRIFGSMNGFGMTIREIIDSYPEFMILLDSVSATISSEHGKNRLKRVIAKVRNFTDDDSFTKFQELTDSVRRTESPLSSHVAEKYVIQASAYLSKDSQSSESFDLSSSESQYLTDIINKSDLNPEVFEADALDLLSEMIALLPEESIREPILDCIYKNMQFESETNIKGGKHLSLPELKEDDLDEKFVRGSGAGGQKINKTASKVILLHKPTQLRVECQETRSLQQNRKIARKRLRLKLDDFVNGSNSRNNVKSNKASMRKAKSKARNKARRKKKMKQSLDLSEKDER